MHKFNHKLPGLMNKPRGRSGKKTAGDPSSLMNSRERSHSLLRAAAGAIVQAAADGIVIVDKENQIQFVNEQIENLFGYRGHDLVGKPIEVLVPERLRRVHSEHRRNYLADPQTRLMVAGLDLVGRHKDGSEFPVEISLTPLKIKGRLFVTCIIRDVTEQKLAVKQLQQQQQRQATLHDIHLAVTSTLDLSTILATLLEKIDLLLPIHASWIWLLNKEAEVLERAACRNINEAEWRGRTLKTIPAIPKLVIESRRPVVVSNMQTDPRVLDPGFFREQGLVSYLGLPLIAKDEVLGVLAVHTRKEYQFSGEEIDFFLLIASQAAIAIDNARLFEQVQKRTQELSALYRITATASQSLELDVVLKEVVKEIAEIFHFENTGIYLHNPHTNELLLRAFLDPISECFSLAKVLSENRGISGTVVQSGEPLIFDDIRNDPRYQELALSRFSQKAGMSFVAMFPIKVKTRPVGTILCVGRKPRCLTPGEVQLITSMADQIGIAVENASLFQETKTKAKELSALYSVTATVSQSLDTDFVLYSTMKKVLELFDFDASSIYLFDNNRKELHLLTYQGLSKEAIPPSSLQSGQGISGRVFETGEPLLFEDIQTDPEFGRLSLTKASLRAGFRGHFSIPVVVKGKTVGVINFLSKEAHRFSPRESQLINAITNHIGIAVENAQLYDQTKKQALQLEKDLAERRQTEEKLRKYQDQLRILAFEISSTEERERRRIAADLHDHTAQNLALSKIKLGALQEATGSSPLLDDIQTLIDGTIEETRSLIFDISPPLLYELGFEPAVDWLAERIHEQHGIVCKIEDDGQPKPLGTNTKIVLFQALRECLLNVSKHAEASQAKVILQREDSCIRIGVEDNGVGFDTSSVGVPQAGRKGFGLFNIRERLELLGGHLEVKSEYGCGTRVTLTVPAES